MENFNKELVDSILRRHLPDSRVQSELGTEIIYSLESEDPSKQTNRNVFPLLFDELDVKKSELGIDSYGISVTSMEDVFVKVSNEKPISNDSISFGLFNTNYEKLNGSALFFSRVKGLLLKRWQFDGRNMELLLTQILLLPITIAIMVLSNIFIKRITEIPSSLTLDLNELYGGSFGFFGSKDNYWQNFGAESYQANARRHGMTTFLIKSQNPDEWLADRQEEVGQRVYEKKYIIGGVVNNLTEGIGLEFWWNSEAIHSLPISINVMYESLISYFVPELKDKITIITRNEALRNEEETSIAAIVWFNILLIFPITSYILSVSFCIFPFHERETKSKLLQLMSVSELMYWMCMALVDLLSILMSAGIVIIVILLLDFSRIFGAIEIIAFILLLIGFVMSYAPIIYSMTLIFKRKENCEYGVAIFSGITGYLLLVPFATFLLMVISNPTEFTDNMDIFGPNGVITNLFKWSPLFALNMGFSKIYLIGSVKSFCQDFQIKVNITEKCIEKSKNFIICCDYFCNTLVCPESSPFSFERIGIFVELSFMIVSALVFWFLLIVFESMICFIFNHHT